MHVNETIAEGLCQCGCGLPTRVSQYGDPRRGIAKGERLKFAAKGHNKRKFISVDGMYKCRRCDGLFGEADFVRDVKKGKRQDIGYCRPCMKAKQDEYKRKNPVQHRMTMLRVRLREYGLTIDDYVSMYERQHGRCAICRVRKLSQLETNARRNSVLNVDHCHATGIVRGLLCTSCNHGLGRFLDNPENLRAAADYLERSINKE